MKDSTDDKTAERRGRPSLSNTGRTVGLDVLADQLSELARALEKEPSLETTLQAIVAAAVGTVPGAQFASITAVSGRRELATVATTGGLPREVDRLQYETGEGPCLTTLYEQETVRLTDSGLEQRWPAFTHRAAAAGMGSMLSVQLYVRGDDLGTLNLFNQQANAFDDESEHVALLFASHAAVTMAGKQHEDELRKAMTSRDRIGQAKGILMERFHVSEDQAFLLLARASSHTNRKLIDIATELTTSGELAGAKPDR